MTTFCLIHGQWHDGSCWATTAEQLRALGDTVLAPDLPFDDSSADYDERARPAFEALRAVADPVVIVGHSRGSAEAALVAARRPPALLVYVCGRFGTLATPPGAPEPFRAGIPFPARDAEGRGVWEPDAAITVMYPRLARDVAQELTDHLRPGAEAVGEYPLTGHPDVPTAVIYTTDDELFTAEWERFVAREMLGVEPIEIPGGHFPMAEDPAMLAALLHRLGTDAVRAGA